MIQAGGDLYVGGQKGKRKWRAAIRDPRGAPNEIIAILPLQDRTFSTSGDYERFIIKDGRRYHHILDPKTGFRFPPVQAPFQEELAEMDSHISNLF